MVHPRNDAPAEHADATRVRWQWSSFIATWLIIAAVMTGWAIATPLSASPDEPSHLVKAASVARGQFLGEPSPLGAIVQVPRYIASAHAETCFAFQPATSAECATPLPGDPGEIIDSTTSAGLYNPTYYALVGWPSLLFSDSTGIYAMRIASALLTALFLALTIAMAPAWRRSPLVGAGILISITPMVLFLGGSVNPNAVEIAGTLAVFTAMLAIMTAPDDRMLALRCAVVIGGSAIAVNTRGISPLWVALALAIPLVFARRKQVTDLFRRPAVWITVGAVGVVTAFAVGWFLWTGILATAPEYHDSRVFPGVGTSAIAGFLMTLASTFGYGEGMIGNFGWLDAPAPLMVYFIWSAFIGVLLIVGLAVLRGRRLAGALTVSALLLLLPAIIQGAYITTGGLIWQGRYALPLFALFAVGIAVWMATTLRATAVEIITRASFVVALGWMIGQWGSFANTLKRYAVGTDGSWRVALLDPEWSAPGGNITWLVLFAILLPAMTWMVWRTSRSLPLVRRSDPASRTAVD